MSRFTLWTIVIGLIIWVAGCNADSRINDRDTQHPDIPVGESLIPAVPQNPAQRVVSAPDSHVFDRFDQVSGRYADWDAEVLNLSLSMFSYSVLSYNLGMRNPDNLAVDGTLNGMWLAVSDYDTGGWNFLGEYNTPQVVDLTGGNYKSPTGWIYFALVCPEGASADVTSTLGINLTETDPPAWQGGVGIKSLDPGGFDIHLEWFEAIDAESPPVTYLIYYAENSVGIDWDTPQLEVSAPFTDTTFGIDENPVLRDYGVRAQDAQGNITDNTNFLSCSITESWAMPIFDWVPGDKLLYTWDDPAMDSQFSLIGPHYLEGNQEDPLDLTGMVEFSEQSGDSGVEEVWAILLEQAPDGGYLVEGQMGNWGVGRCVTYSLNLLDNSGNLKTHIGNYTIEPDAIAGGDLCYLRKGTNTWPQHETWQTGDRIEVTWDDPAQNVDLWIEGPMWEYGSPTYPFDFDGKVDFSQASEDSGEAVEWATLTDGGDLGNYMLSIQWMDEDGPDPGTFDVTWTLYDSEGGVRLGPGTAEIDSDWGGVHPLFWLDKE